jgi:hypothetical protein
MEHTFLVRFFAKYHLDMNKNAGAKELRFLCKVCVGWRICTSFFPPFLGVKFHISQ